MKENALLSWKYTLLPSHNEWNMTGNILSKRENSGIQEQFYKEIWKAPGPLLASPLMKCSFSSCEIWS